MAETIVVKSKVKEELQDSNLGGDFTEALNEEVKRLVQRAKERAKANGHKTVTAKDL